MKHPCTAKLYELCHLFIFAAEFLVFFQPVFNLHFWAVWVTSTWSIPFQRISKFTIQCVVQWIEMPFPGSEFELNIEKLWSLNIFVIWSLGHCIISVIVLGQLKVFSSNNVYLPAFCAIAFVVPIPLLFFPKLVSIPSILIISTGVLQLCCLIYNIPQISTVLVIKPAKLLLIYSNIFFQITYYS